MTLKTVLLSAALATGALAGMAIPASAYIACNSDGDCWHVDSRYAARPALRFDDHPDDWYFHREWRDNDRPRWRTYHEGRGYWRGGVWVTF